MAYHHKHAMMHFNHVIKLQVQSPLAHQFLLYFMVHGVATLGTSCQPGFDAVYPYLYNGLDLDTKKVGFIIVQVKNDLNVSPSEYPSMFLKMDPLKCGLLSGSNMEDRQFPIPIIHIIFLLSSPCKPKVTHMKYSVPSEGAIIGEDGQLWFTSYDFVCSGISPEVLQPVTELPGVWEALVNKWNKWHSFYDVPVPSVLQLQIPGCGDSEVHFNSWLGVTVFL